MEKIAIRFVRENQTAMASKGETLLAVQVAAGLHPDAPCGGQGTCGKCKVEIRRPGENAWTEVLSCQTAVEEELEVRTPDTAELNVLTDSLDLACETGLPWVEQYEIVVPPCAPAESTADWERMKEALEAVTGRSQWQPNLSLASKLGPLCKSTGGRIHVITVEDRVLDAFAEPQPIYLAAFDVGTTSIAGYLLRDGVPVAVCGTQNPQVQYGGDVIMRANYAIENGAMPLAKTIRKATDALLGELCTKAGIERNAVYAMSLVGNTCMHHLYLNIVPESLAHAPYNPAIHEGLVLRAAEFGQHIHPEAVLLMPPVIAGFVGADTVACLLACNWEHMEKTTLMIDIGTNGEVVLGNKDRMIACSTAAGPAFEGAKIHCGMRGAEGAVDHARIEDGKLVYHVIGDGEAKGICGSGLIDLIACLVKMGEIDDMGKLESGSFYRLGESEVILTQQDIREVQLAKGAICAGIRLLAWKLGIELEQIDQVYIAGAFGNYMDSDSACDIGLIPGELRDRIIPIGNAAGEGAKLAVQGHGAWDMATRVSRQAEFLELAALPQFQDEFVDALEFPVEE